MKMAMLHNRQAPGRDFHTHFSLAPARSDTNPPWPSNPQSAPAPSPLQDRAQAVFRVFRVRELAGKSSSTSELHRRWGIEASHRSITAGHGHRSSPIMHAFFVMTPRIESAVGSWQKNDVDSFRFTSPIVAKPIAVARRA